MIVPDTHDPTPYIEASAKYFPALAEGDPVGESFGDTYWGMEGRGVYGVTMNQDASWGIGVADFYNDDQIDAGPDVPISPDTSSVMRACVKAALDEMYPDLLEYGTLSSGIVQEIGHSGIRFILERKVFDTDEEKERFLDGLEGAVFPSPLDKTKPVTAYVFLLLGSDNNAVETLGIGAAVYATRDVTGYDFEIRPLETYAEPVALDDASDEDETEED